MILAVSILTILYINIESVRSGRVAHGCFFILRQICAFRPLGADSPVVGPPKAYFELLRYFERILCYFQVQI